MLHRSLPRRDSHHGQRHHPAQLKERVVDEFYDPITMLFRKIRGT